MFLNNLMIIYLFLREFLESLISPLLKMSTLTGHGLSVIMLFKPHSLELEACVSVVSSLMEAMLKADGKNIERE